MRVWVIPLRCLTADLDRLSVPHSNVRRNTDTAGSGGKFRFFPCAAKCLFGCAGGEKAVVPLS